MRSAALFNSAALRLALMVLLSAGLAAPQATARPTDPVAATAPTAPDRARMRMNQRVFDTVWNTVRRDYYDPHTQGVDWNRARAEHRPRAIAARDDRELYGVLQQMLSLLHDEHAGVTSPAATRRQDRLRQRRAVLGLVFHVEGNGVYRVERIRAGSPAEEAGIGVGWRLVTADGAGWNPDQDVVPDQVHHLVFLDPADGRHLVDLTPREMDPTPAFIADRSRPGVLVLTIDGFEPGLGRWMGEQLKDLPPETEVVLDLRGNPGGRLREADAVLSCYLPRGRDWARQTARSGRATDLTLKERCGDLTHPVANALAVLVDGTSRSAAELTPAALQEAGRAVVVGEPTAGAVLISRETNLPDGGRMTLSRYDFVTAGGVRLEKHGVTPDVRLDDRAQADGPAAIDAALAALAGRRDTGLASTPATPF